MNFNQPAKRSVNDGIPKYFFSLTHITMDMATEQIWP